MSDFQAYALGIDEEIPLFALKLPDRLSTYLDQDLGCEFKPAILNVTYENRTFALCIIQFRLDGKDALVFTIYFDLMQEKDYTMAKSLLKMQNYNIIIATQTVHRMMAYKANFVGTFDPRKVLEQTIQQADSSDNDLCREVFSGIAAQFKTAAKMWYALESIASSHHRWYAKL